MPVEQTYHTDNIISTTMEVMTNDKNIYRITRHEKENIVIYNDV
ncbi:hypothetical protein [Orientia tsutsugamushi]|uniref:Uncharacterized protein n=1 Tax=Orientia tsutsugamushi TaxID=784 RepID=A0A2U3R7I2_ORITS|nr:hypothetical protein [Orientia tsutsugamushi]SPR09118.1 Uncharacterised protein [Orientia tsutsugamushi]